MVFRCNSKIRHVLAQRHIDDNTIEYLVQIVGETAQNATWKHLSDLDIKARNALNADLHH